MIGLCVCHKTTWFIGPSLWKAQNIIIVNNNNSNYYYFSFPTSKLSFCLTLRLVNPQGVTYGKLRYVFLQTLGIFSPVTNSAS